MKTKPKIRILVRDIVQDIRGGMTDSELQARYNLTGKGLERTFFKLVKGRHLTADEVDRRAKSGRAKGPPLDTLAYFKMYPSSSVLACDKGNMRNRGTIRNLGDNHVTLRGFKADVGASLTLLTLGDEFGEFRPFEMDVKCRWVKIESAGVDKVAGFEIMRVPPDCRNDFEALLKRLKDKKSG